MDFTRYTDPELKQFINDIQAVLQVRQLCDVCGYQKFRHVPYYRRMHLQTMPAGQPICNKEW